MALALYNDDELTEILLRLPAKSLIRFKSVCKKWLDLISSDYFCHQHTLRPPRLQQSFIIEMHSRQFFYFSKTTNGEKVVMTPYPLNVPDNHQIVQDCNGLLLLAKPLESTTVSLTEESERHLKYNYYVCNPTTKRSRKITLQTNNVNLPYVAAVALAFDPSKSPYYKIICFRSSTKSRYLSLGSYTYQIEVYDSESHTWNLGFEPFISPCCLTIFDKVIHWNSSMYLSLYLDDDNLSFDIASFDIAKNEMKRLVRPHGQGDSECYLQESNGRLYLFELLEGQKRISVAVWELGGDDHSQWLLKHRGEIYQDYHKVDVSPVRLMVGSDGDETCSLVVYEYKCKSEPEVGRVMAYNFLDKSYELLVDFTCQPDVIVSNFIIDFQCGETLALV